jgi:diacylglycerol kinase family enzyme
MSAPFLLAPRDAMARWEASSGTLAPARTARPLKFAAVINAAAAGARGAPARLSARLALPHDRIFVAGGGDLVTALRRAAAHQPDAVLVWGGDGTARTAVETLSPLGVATAPLPGGTLNRLARNVHGTGDLDQVLAGMAAGAPAWIPAGRVAARPFYVAAGLGAPMRLNAVREALRRGRLDEAWRRWRTAAPALFTEPLAADGQAATLALIGVGRLDAAFGLGRADSVSGLEIAAARWTSVFDAAAIIPFALAGGWRGRPGVSVRQGDSARFVSPAGAIPALLDGESVTLPAAADLTFEPRAGLVWRRRPGL